MMMHGRHRHRNRVQAQVGGQKRLNRRKNRNGVLGGRFRGAGFIRLNRGCEDHTQAGGFELPVDTKMVAAKGPGAGNSDTQDGLAGYFPAPLPSTALRQRP